MNNQAEILLAREGGLGRITLNRPKAINALTFGMVREMTAALKDWRDDETVVAVLIHGAGDRGLCAGGDIRAIYDAALAKSSEPIQFWREEYALNLAIADYEKPVVAIMNGIVMGGGIGVSAHASHRVVTETTAIAMPETSIGFIPDVGASCLLPRAPGELGTHLALTAGRVGAADSILLGLADTHVPGEKLPALFETLAGCGAAGDVNGALGLLKTAPAPGKLARAKSWIDAAYAADSVEEICANLRARPEPEAQAAGADILRNSPTSLKVALQMLRRGRALAKLDACLGMELNIAGHCLFGRDFPEGIRAAVIDKDRKPQWSPSRLEEVSAAAAEDYFKPLKPA
jgi:enoyl-CoA hydratase